MFGGRVVELFAMLCLKAPGRCENPELKVRSFAYRLVNLSEQLADVETRVFTIAFRLESDRARRHYPVDASLPTGRTEIEGLACQLSQKLSKYVFEAVRTRGLERTKSGNYLLAEHNTSLETSNKAAQRAGRESENLGSDRAGRRAELSRPYRPLGCCAFLSQGIGLRPQPWARISRPVGPVLLSALRGNLSRPLEQEASGRYPPGTGKSRMAIGRRVISSSVGLPMMCRSRSEHLGDPPQAL